MNQNCTIQLFANGVWHDVASVSLFGAEAQGWRAKTYSGYAVEWAVEHAGARDAWALGSGWPVGLEPFEANHWPVFLIDMLPQGYGRAELLRQLGLSETLEETADWRLLLAGASNPIGHLRIKEAAHWLAQRTGPCVGFTDAEVAARSEQFIDYLSAYGLFVAGSSGVQGEWPKLLMTRAKDGLLYLDHTLDDALASEHYIVKFGRGSNARLAQILRHEAPYMAIAQHLGLRVHRPLCLQERALFVPRFDRRITATGVERLAQESIAALTGKPGFGVVPSHDEVCQRLAQVCTDPQAEVLEYIKRDVANLALGNKDNHARNTAVQRDFAGHIALTPLFDFAPMYLHPDGIARRIRWEGNDHGAPNWQQVIDTVCERNRLNRPFFIEGLRAMAPTLARLAQEGEVFGLEPDVHAFLAHGMAKHANALAALR
jgi:serine/threonine-protein kinase HipA